MAPPNLTVLLQGERVEDQIGYHRAWTHMEDDGQLSGYRAFPYRGPGGPERWPVLFREVLDHMRHSGSDALLCQYFHGRGIPDPRPFLNEVRQLPQRPVVVTSCGDPFGAWGAAPPSSLLRAASASDLTFTTSMGRLADRLERAGARRITLMPNGACDVRFGATPPPPDDTACEFDVVFIGSRSGGHNPSRRLYWTGRRRAAYVSALTKRFGARFGLFGHGWAGLRSWQGPVPFDQQVAATQRGHVVFGGYPNSVCDYYTSNRPFMALLAGVPLVDHAVPLVDRLLEPGREWVLGAGVKDTLLRVDALLETDDSHRRALGAAGAAAVRSRHMDSHRANLMVESIGAVGEALRNGGRPAPPEFDFFHSGVDPSRERQTACRAW